MGGLRRAGGGQKGENCLGTGRKGAQGGCSNGVPCILSSVPDLFLFSELCQENCASSTPGGAGDLQRDPLSLPESSNPPALITAHGFSVWLHQWEGKLGLGCKCSNHMQMSRGLKPPGTNEFPGRFDNTLRHDSKDMHKMFTLCAFDLPESLFLSFEIFH